jgi:hypothetical protein
MVSIAFTCERGRFRCVYTSEASMCIRLATLTKYTPEVLAVCAFFPENVYVVCGEEHSYTLEWLMRKFSVPRLLRALDTLSKQQKKRFHAQYAHVGVEELPLAMLNILAFTHEQWNDTYLKDDRCARLYVSISVAETCMSCFTGGMEKHLAFQGDAVRKTSITGIARTVQFVSHYCEEEDTEREQQVKDEWADTKDDEEGGVEVVDAEYPEADSDTDTDNDDDDDEDEDKDGTIASTSTGMLTRADVQKVRRVKNLELAKTVQEWFTAYFNTVLTTGREENPVFKDAYYGKDAVLAVTARRSFYKDVTSIVVEQRGTAAFIPAFIDAVMNTLIKLGYTAFVDTRNAVCINIDA